LAGLIAGDGYFSKKQLVIVFSSSDLILAEFLQKRLNSGHIYPIKNKNAYTYIVSRTRIVLILFFF
jgi:hypothetical protein